MTHRHANAVRITENPDRNAQSKAASRPLDRRWLAIGLAALLAIAQLLWGERVPAHEGLGWDGVYYAAFARDFPKAMQEEELSSDELRRLLPSAAVYTGLRAIGSPRRNRDVITAFLVLAAISVVGAAFFFVKIAELLQLSETAFWLSFLGGFLSFGVAKFLFFYPVLCDSTAFLVSFASLYAFLRGRTAWVAGLGAIGYFCWPSAAIVNALMLLFPFRADTNRLPDRPSRAELCGSALVALVFVAGCCFEYFVRHIYNFYGTYLNHPLWPGSVLLAAAYLFVGFRTLGAGTLDNMRREGIRPLLFRLFGVMAGFGLISLAIRAFAAHFTMPHWQWSDGRELLEPPYILFESIGRPLRFWVSDTVFLGPPVFLIAVMFRRWAQSVAALGTAAVGAVLFHWILSLDSEARHLFYVWPLVMVSLGIMLNGLRLGAAEIAAWTFLCLAFSRLWFPLNHGALTDEPRNFPDQYYFMTQGPWMNSESYRWQGAIALLVLAAFVWWRRRTSRTREQHCATGASLG